MNSLPISRIKAVLQIPLAIIIILPMVLYVTPYRGVGIYLYTFLGGVLGLLYILKGVRKKILLESLSFILVVLVLGLLIALIKLDHNAILLSINLIVSLIISAVLIDNQKAANVFVKLFFYFIFSWYLFCVVTIGISPADANDYLYNLSRNHVSFLLIISTVLYYSNKVFNDRTFSVFPALVLLVSTVILYGRSGILVSLLLLFIVISITFYRLKLSAKILTLSVTFFVVLFVLNSSLKEMTVIFDYLNLSERSERSIRIEMLFSYLRSLDLESLILGGDLSKISPINLYDNNPHNSFISGHSAGGINLIFLIAFLSLLSLYSILIKPEPSKYILFVFFILLLVRAFFDSLFFFSVFDPLLFYLFLSAFKYRRNDR